MQEIIKEANTSIFSQGDYCFEFDRNDNWDLLDRICEKLGGHEDIWYATNIEIYEYVEAYGRLIFSVDGSKVYNPSALKLYFQAGSQVVCVKPDETISLG